MASLSREPARVESAPDKPYSPTLRQPPEQNVYFGDLHLHTNLSMDAYLQGGVSVSQADAYRFAMGQTVRSDSGVDARLQRPLDFLAVTDHAGNLGLNPSHVNLKLGSLFFGRSV